MLAECSRSLPRGRFAYIADMSLASRSKSLCLTFDVEEFDLPADVGVNLSRTLRRDIAREGGERLLELIPLLGPFTCFVTGTFARRHPGLVGRLAAAGCEIACHGLDHGDRYGSFSSSELMRRLSRARELLQENSGQEVTGHRGPRFSPAPEQVLLEAGFSYDSSIHPTWVPGRYNHLLRPLNPQRSRAGLWQVPVTVLPVTRLPLSWIWFRNYPEALLRLTTRSLARRSALICVYFHSWVLCDINSKAGGLPWPVRRNTGPALTRRLEGWAAALEDRGFASRCNLDSFISSQG